MARGQRGATAVAAYAILGEDELNEQRALREQLAAADPDGILIYRLIALDERNVFRNPEPNFRAPAGLVFGDPYYSYYYPNPEYYRYWRSTWEVTGSPGYPSRPATGTCTWRIAPTAVSRCSTTI